MIIVLNSKKLSANSLDSQLNQLGFLEAQREVYLFIDKGVYETIGDVTSGKALVLNYSVSSTQKQLFDNPQFKNSNTKLIMMNLYTFDITINTSITDFNNIEFNMLNAYTNSVCNIYGAPNDDPKTYTNGYSFYSSRIKNSDNDIKEFFIEQESDNAPIPLPYYYTKTHEDFDLGDSALLNSNHHETNFYGDRLKDRNTKIRVFDLNSWFNKLSSSIDIMNSLNIDLADDFELDEDIIDLSVVSDNLLNPTISSQLGGICYGYDSNKGSVDVVYHPSSISIPLAKYQSKQRVANQIDVVKNYFENTCKGIESTHGNINVMFSPNKIADKTKMIFRDYRFDNQPCVGNDEMVNKDETIDTNINKTVFDIMTSFDNH